MQARIRSPQMTQDDPSLCVRILPRMARSSPLRRTQRRVCHHCWRNRILLSFQHNVKTENVFALPTVSQGQVLSFGIFLRELGYSELDMPLDGKDGRPTVAQIADGEPHTIAACYDSFSARKRIAIDGQIRFTHQFPTGHCSQSGGPKTAMIGGWRKRESFGGVIDELAIYEYALSDEEIAHHHTLARQGLHWLSNPPHERSNWKTVQTVSQGDLLEMSLSTVDQDSLSP